MASLAPDERRRAERIRNPRRRRQFVCGRWLLRIHAARLLDRDPGSLTIRTNADSPPVLAGTAMRVGLSHSGDVCLCISSPDAAVGCDVEWQRPRPRLTGIAAHYFHEKESTALANGDAQADFYRLWTLKEASGKARGHGIRRGLRVPAFTLRPDFRCLVAPDREPWTFATTRLSVRTDEYAVAFAVSDEVSPDTVSAWRCRFRDHGVRCEVWRPAWQFAGAHPATPRVLAAM
jgi:4'-phosphopantetheinyl transferase